MIDQAVQLESASYAAGVPSHPRTAGVVRGAVTITVLVLIVAGTCVVGALALSGCGTDLFAPGGGTTETADSGIPGANEDAFLTASGLAIARVRIVSLDGVFVLYDAAVPKDLADRRPAYVAWWNDFAARKRFVFGRLIESQADVGHALLNLERDLDVDLDSLIDDNPELNQAIVDAATQSEYGIDWQPATYGTAVQIMGFPAPQPTGDPDMDRLLFANGGVDEFYQNLCRPAFKTTMELLPSPGPLPGPYMPITLAIGLSGCGDREPAVDEARALSEDDTPPGLADAPVRDIVLYSHCHCFFHPRNEAVCEGPCCDDPCCDDPVCCGDSTCGCSGPCCGSPINPCCGNPDPCCGDPDPCCGSPDPCCGVNCDDGNACTYDICQGGECPHPPTNEGGACDDDGDPCTDDFCQGTVCIHPFDCGGGESCCPAGQTCCDGVQCCDVEKCCVGDCCADNETCCNGLCEPSSCSFTVEPATGCAGGTVELTLSGECEPGCENMTFSMEKSVQYLTVSPPAGIPCADSPQARIFTVTIDADAPAGQIIFGLRGETTATACAALVIIDVATTTMNDVTVTRGENATFNVTMTPPTDVTYSNWRFAGGGQIITRTGDNNVSTWSEPLAVPGTLSVDVTCGSNPAMTVSGTANVNPRTLPPVEDFSSQPVNRGNDHLPAFPGFYHSLADSHSRSVFTGNLTVQPINIGPNTGFIYIIAIRLLTYTMNVHISSAINDPNHPFHIAAGDGAQWTVEQVNEVVSVHEGLTTVPGFTSHWGQGRDFALANPMAPDLEDDVEHISNMTALDFGFATEAKLLSGRAAINLAMDAEPTNVLAGSPDMEYPIWFASSVTVSVGASMPLPLFSIREGSSPMFSTTGAQVFIDSIAKTITGVTPGTGMLTLTDNEDDYHSIPYTVTPQ